MGTVTITIETLNSAFDNDNLEREVARIIDVAAGDVRAQGLISPISLHDINGNHVGQVKFDDED